MRKMKTIFLSVAIVLAVGAALATNSKRTCPQPEYYKIGNNYFPAGGIEGIDYSCESAPGSVCTYYIDKSTGQYRQCRRGKYVPLP